MRAFVCLLLLNVLTGCVLRLPDTVRRVNDLEYARVNGQPLQLDLYTPKQPVGKLPVLVWIHGGSWKAGSKHFCPIGFMATQNVAVVSIDYRLSETASFPAQLHDCKGAIRWLRAHADEYQLDANHIGIFGASAGGHLAALLGTTAQASELEGTVGGNLHFSSGVQAVCAFYAPTDLDRLVADPKDRKNPQAPVARLLGGAVENHLAQAAAASPVTHVSKDSAPFFLLHGEKDTLVPAEQSRLLHAALRQAGVETHLEIIPGKGHGIIAPPAAAEKIYQFFQKHLRAERPDGL